MRRLLGLFGLSDLPNRWLGFFSGVPAVIAGFQRPAAGIQPCLRKRYRSARPKTAYFLKSGPKLGLYKLAAIL